MPLVGIALVPVAGILLGGAMTATSLAGRRALDELAARRGEYEAALALGLLERDAALLVARPPAAQALTPALDQTRTVGLVTLPGAFVGVLLGSGDPVQAAAAQVLVLIGLLAAEAVAVVITVELVARGRIRRVEPRAAAGVGSGLRASGGDRSTQAEPGHAPSPRRCNRSRTGASTRFDVRAHDVRRAVRRGAERPAA